MLGRELFQELALRVHGRDVPLTQQRARDVLLVRGLRLVQGGLLAMEHLRGVTRPWRYGGAVRSEEIEIRTGSREGVHDLTRDCERFVSGDAERSDGLLHVWVPHATAGLAIMETGSGSDDDLLAVLRELLPPGRNWQHGHGSPGHGRDHLLPTLLAPQVSIPVIGSKLALGTWQSVCLVDTNADNGTRRVRLSLLAG